MDLSDFYRSVYAFGMTKWDELKNKRKVAAAVHSYCNNAIQSNPELRVQIDSIRDQFLHAFRRSI